MVVHRKMGPGFLEAVCQEALALEFDERGAPYQREVELPILYKGRQLDTPYRADFIGTYIFGLIAFRRSMNVEPLEYKRLTSYV